MNVPHPTTTQFTHQTTFAETGSSQGVLLDAESGIGECISNDLFAFHCEAANYCKEFTKRYCAHDTVVVLSISRKHQDSFLYLTVIFPGPMRNERGCKFRWVLSLCART